MRWAHAAGVVAVLVVGGCATRTMREHAGAMVRAGEQLERETAAFAEARTGVVQLRQRSLVEQRAEAATRGQQNAATLAQWRVAKTEDRAKQLALFEGVREASEAMYSVRDQSLAWEESVLATRSALAVDRAALHRFVLQLVRLAQPGRFVDEVKFLAEYGGQIGEKVGGELQDVLAGVKAAEVAAAAAGDKPTTLPGSVPGTPNPNPNPNPNPANPNPANPNPDPARPNPTMPPTLPIGPSGPPDDPTRPQGFDEIKSGPRRPVAPGTPGENK
jgi:hypothetical protein